MKKVIMSFIALFIFLGVTGTANAELYNNTPTLPTITISSSVISPWIEIISSKNTNFTSLQKPEPGASPIFINTLEYARTKITVRNIFY